MELEKIELLRAIAEMAYAVAKADRGLSAQERIAFNKIVEEELDLDSWAAQSRFQLLDEVTQPTLEKAYNEAIHDFKKYKQYLTPDLREKAIRVMEKVAQSCSGLSGNEILLLDKLKNDLNNL